LETQPRKEFVRKLFVVQGPLAPENIERDLAPLLRAWNWNCSDQPTVKLVQEDGQEAPQMRPLAGFKPRFGVTYLIFDKISQNVAGWMLNGYHQYIAPGFLFEGRSYLLIPTSAST
jgi:hypothetical protein